MLEYMCITYTNIHVYIYIMYGCVCDAIISASQYVNSQSSFAPD